MIEPNENEPIENEAPTGSGLSLREIVERIIAVLATFLGVVPSAPSALAFLRNSDRMEALAAYKRDLAKDAERRRAVMTKALAQMERDHAEAIASAEAIVRTRRGELDRALAKDAAEELVPLIASHYEEPTRAAGRAIRDALVKYRDRAMKELGEELSGVFVSRLFLEPLVGCSDGAVALFVPTRANTYTTDANHACQNLRDHLPEGALLTRAIEDIESRMREAIGRRSDPCTDAEREHAAEQLAVTTRTSYERALECFEEARRCKNDGRTYVPVSERRVAAFTASDFGPHPIGKQPPIDPHVKRLWEISRREIGRIAN
ncbi:MAG: hypothetical protein J0L92_29310 [Deltaproteobacteria bacterium]|nr:hypothetical protein [Deltaproteobacteria bacterium]